MSLSEKKSIRSLLLEKRKSLDKDLYSYLSAKVVDNCLRFIETKRPRTVLLFWPIAGEPDIRPLFDHLLQREDLTLTLPKVEDDDLSLYAIKSLEDLQVGKYKVMEPINGLRIEPQQVDLAFVPGLAFDLKGYRLGFGKGFYDKLLPRIRGEKVGVCFSFQVLEELPRDTWDVPVDYILTEDYIKEVER
ncbi:5-formyltetrahydrofolate cyclo-ligase [Thermocrinis minervae]|uniref:5-formyltetrahydrofolate cyclo-ligase n=1 Tax=Thermocrinis minervae TaxID=381751 RepID=A0A1M6Q3M4_9AQUI|nr:5-formyltetrahydrofolate cyclo-ligase [Thermocrinis minervae]SHK14707.1 5-formyltetrahydrofolate cyclo-ligase [Thermocrinis minervae]